MSTITEVKIPDIGDFDEVEVIEILVANGDSVSKEDPLVSLESDKATMEIPSPGDGIVSDIKISIGDKVSEGTVVMMLESSADSAPPSSQPEEQNNEVEPPAATQEPNTQQTASPPPASTDQSAAAPVAPHQPPASLPPPVEKSGTATPHASPAIRRYARELGADLKQVRGSGPKGRILKGDVKQWIKTQLSESKSNAGSGQGAGIPEIPAVDFSKFGEIETISLGRIKKLSGPHLQRAWLNIPHVTHNDEADITDLEAFRQSLKAEAEKEGIRVTLLAFILKFMVSGLKKFPSINASLHPNGENLILKKYYNIGIAVDTPQGLVVPVIRDVDRKSVFELAGEMGELGAKAREGKLSPKDLQGGCISISSLGGIGGTSFTPIVNAPEVAILGIARSKMAPVWNGESFEPRLMLPLSLSYDHRVIDGAEGARFCSYLRELMADARRLAL